MIELKNISKTYNHNNNSQVILDDVSHVFEEGSNTSILGESGSGKTTLLNLIGGIDLEFEGELLFRGKPVKDFDRFRREHVSFIYQELNLVSHLSLVKNITVSLTNNVKNREEKAIELLKRVGLYDHRDKKPHQLSGGERQRVAIARALARETDILLCDEPTGSLDDETKIEIMDLIMNVFKDKTVIFVTHDEDLAQNYSDVILKFDENGIDCQIKRTPDKKNTSGNRSSRKRTFNRRFEFNLLSRKLSLLNSSCLIIIVGAVFLLVTGIIEGIETEVDIFYTEHNKIDKIDVNTTRYSIVGFADFVERFNAENESKISGFTTSVEMNTDLVDYDSIIKLDLFSLQPGLRDTFEKDLIAGRYPQGNNEILYSKGSALNSLFRYYSEVIRDRDMLIDRFYKLSQLTDEEILEAMNRIEVSYKNTYPYNPTEWFYDEDLEIVGLIDDYRYFPNNARHFEYKGEKIEVPINSNIYMLEGEFQSYITNVYVGLKSKKFREFSVFVEEEDFNLRNEVFAGFLLHGFQISGRDSITNERNAYNEMLHGYKLTLTVGCFILLSFGGTSIYNGIRSNIEKNKKNIGIYKSIGYTSRNIKAMFIIEGCIISLFIVSLSIITWYVIKLIMNDQIVSALDLTNKFGVDNVTYLAPFSLCIVALLVVSIIATSINKEFRKINILSLIRHK